MSESASQTNHIPARRTTKRRIQSTTLVKEPVKKRPPLEGPISAEALRQRLLAASPSDNAECHIIYLNADQSSWLLHYPGWYPCPNQKVFEEEWNLHPPERHLLKVYGRVVAEKRWSQSWGFSYAYSGATNPGRAIPPQSRVAHLLATINDWMKDEGVGEKKDRRPYNACLQNWYEVEDTIGRHADDERDMRHGWPIFSLSWGGPRRFVLRKKSQTTSKTDVFLHDGDLLVMGGRTQDTHFHEVPKRRVTMDPPSGRRINWTLRAFHERQEKNGA